MVDSEKWLLLRALIEHNRKSTKIKIQNVIEDCNVDEFNKSTLIGSYQTYETIIEAMNDLECQ